MKRPQCADDGLLGVEQASIELQGRHVLDRVTMAVGESEIVTVIGPNGSGKTTLVKVLLGIVPLSAGRVVRRPGLRIGYVPQHLNIPSTMPVTIARFLAMGRSRPRASAGQVLERVGLGLSVDQAIQSVSGGEFRRILLARALLNDPQLLVLDEPTAGMDVQGQNELYRIVNELRDRQGCAALLVSHDLHLVMASTGRVICLNHHVCCEGQPEAVSRNPDYLRLFGYQDGDQIAVYRHHHDHQHDLSGETISHQENP